MWSSTTNRHSRKSVGNARSWRIRGLSPCPSPCFRLKLAPLCIAAVIIAPRKASPSCRQRDDPHVSSSVGCERVSLRRNQRRLLEAYGNGLDESNREGEQQTTGMQPKTNEPEWIATRDEADFTFRTGKSAAEDAQC